MSGILGTGLLAVTALLFAWAYGQFRRPQPAAWTRSDFAAVSVTLTFACMFTFSLAFLGAFIYNLGTETRWLEIAAVAGGGLLLCWFACPRLMAPALRAAGTPAALSVTAIDTLPGPANDPQPTSPERPGPSAAKRHKKRAA